MLRKMQYSLDSLSGDPRKHLDEFLRALSVSEVLEQKAKRHFGVFEDPGPVAAVSRGVRAGAPLEILRLRIPVD